MLARRKHFTDVQEETSFAPILYFYYISAKIYFISVNQSNATKFGHVKPDDVLKLHNFYPSNISFTKKKPKQPVGKPLWFTLVNLCKLQAAHNFDAVF